MMMKILTLQQYYNEKLILQQHSIYNVLNGHFKVPAILQKPFWQLYKYSDNIARFQWNIFEISPQYYGAMSLVNIIMIIVIFHNNARVIKNNVYLFLSFYRKCFHATVYFGRRKAASTSDENWFSA